MLGDFGDLLELVCWIGGIVVWFIEVFLLYKRYSKDLDNAKFKKNKRIRQGKTT